MPKSISSVMSTKRRTKKKFFMTKSSEPPTFQKEVKLIAKAEDEKKLVYGVVYEPDIQDAHGDFMTAEEIQKAAHGFLKNARKIDKDHNFQGGVGEVVESYVAPADFEVNGETIVKGSWVLVQKPAMRSGNRLKKEASPATAWRALPKRSSTRPKPTLKPMSPAVSFSCLSSFLPATNKKRERKKKR